MSHRPNQAKRVKRLKKALRPSPESYIDLIQYLKDRRYASSTAEATRMLVEGKVRVESHPVGRMEVDNPLKKGEKIMIAQPLLMAQYQKDIIVNA